MVAWLASFLLHFYNDQKCGAPEDLKLMSECTCLLCSSDFFATSGLELSQGIRTYRISDCVGMRTLDVCAD